ncbi:MAG: diaminopimelate epimerase [Chloroflexota bacterium]
MKFTKMQSAGNDYVLIETGGNHHDWVALATKLCDRHYGIGADSLLLLIPSEKADFRMRVFDADGSEAEACGNGIRCLARYAYEMGMVKNGAEQIRVETMAGVRTLDLKKAGGRLQSIQVSMGAPQFQAERIPVAVEKGGEIVDINGMLQCTVHLAGRAMALNLVSMGNPHAVFFQQQPVTGFPLNELGPEVEHLKIFPNRINFEVVRVLDRGKIEARVWERGVGETLACGSGACAINVAAQKLGYADKKIDVQVPGGILEVSWDGTGEVLLSGPAEIVYTGEWPYEE